MDNFYNCCIPDNSALFIPESFEECFTYELQILWLKNYVDSIDPSAAPDLTEIKQRLANVEADIRRLDREIDDIDLSGINAEIEAINNQLQSISDAQNTQAADIAALQSGKQDKLTAGDNITLTPQADGSVKISSTGGGGGSVAVDGTVTQDGTNPVTGAGIYQFVHDITDPMSEDLDDIAQDIVDLQNASTATSQTIAGIHTTQQQQTADIQQLQTSDQQQDADIGANRDKIAQHDTDIQQLQSDVDAVETNVNAILVDYVKDTVYAPFVQQTNNTLTEHTQQITDLTDNKQNKLVSGSENITITPNEDGTDTISAYGVTGTGGIKVSKATSAGVTSYRVALDLFASVGTSIGVSGFTAASDEPVSISLSYDSVIKNWKQRNRYNFSPTNNFTIGTTFDVTLTVRVPTETTLQSVPVPKLIWGGRATNSSADYAQLQFIGAPQLQTVAATETEMLVYSVATVVVRSELQSGLNCQLWIEF